MPWGYCKLRGRQSEVARRCRRANRRQVSAGLQQGRNHGEMSRKFPKRVLQPIERISEVLFGLIMALTFTGTLSAAESGRAEVHTMLVGALGCNLAWGFVDAIMYLMGCLAE